MLDHIPFDIQSAIMKRLPVKTLLQFRSVSKHWKSFIDSPKFINNYHVNQANPQHHMFLRYNLDNVKTLTSIIDNNTFPQHKFPLISPKSLRLSAGTSTIGSVNGLLCFWWFYGNANSKKYMVVIWNPTVRKSVAIVVIPKPRSERTIVGFGVCLDNSDPKLVKITVAKLPSMWEVEVFTLSTRVWKIVFTGAPFKSCHLLLDQVFVNGVIYFRAYAGVSNIVISFDLESEKFGEMCLPERLVHTSSLDLRVAKVNESLGLLEYYFEGDMRVCGVWKREDGANKTFSKIYTVKVEGKSLYHSVLGFRYNGEVVIKLDGDNYGESRIAVYEPLSGHINDVGINGKLHAISVCSYMETLLLLNESDSIIR